MFFEALLHLMELDVGWFLYIILTNLHYLLAFIVLIYFFYEGKDVIWGLIFITLMLWAIDSVSSVFGWVVFVGGFLSLYYISKIVLLMLAADSPFFERYLVLISSIQAYAVWVIYNLYLV